MDPQPNVVPAPSDRWTRGEIAYASVLFVAAVVTLSFAISRTGVLQSGNDLGEAVFFLCYGLFTIIVGYRHPNFGYYSFDRVSQVASILVLGPVDAAWVNGLASFIYPWHRVLRGAPLRNAFYAALNNSGLMTLIILGAGYVYIALGGAVPLAGITGWSVVTLTVLVLGMQLLNDAGMLGLFHAAGRSTAGFFSTFSYAIEVGSGATAVLVAIVYNSMETSVLVLLLAVLSVGMLALRQFANMRQKLELLVDERTRSLREKTRELELQATRDKLTGLYNRRYADQYLVQQLASAVRYQQSFTIALADIDLFKQVNDGYSHATGDEVLRRVAAMLRERCRKTDMIARYGGEEFLICFPHTDLAQARVLSEELRAAIAAAEWAQLGLASGVTLSFGIAERRNETSPDILLGRADRHLYAAKNNGRNLVVA